MLESLYHRDIVDLARASRTRGRLAAPDRSARADNPLCGDRVTMDLALDGGGAIAAIGHLVRGCALCEAAAEAIAETAVGMEPADIAAARAGARSWLKGQAAAPPWGRLSLFAPVRDVPSRHECVLLPFAAAERALAGDGA